jgi:hypothetical protein
MGETVKLTETIRMIWRDAAMFIAQAMREEVAESGNKSVEEWALEVETFADGLIPLFDGWALRDGWNWKDEKVLSTLKASGRLQTAILQGMGALNPAVRAEFVARGDGSKWTRAFIEEQQWRKAAGLAISQEYVIYEAFRLFMSTVAETKQPEVSAAGNGVSAKQLEESTDRQQGRKAVSFRHLQECFDNATEEDRKKYFLSGSGRHGKQKEYFRDVLDDIEKDYGGTIEMNTFIRYDVRNFKKDLKKRIADKENG